jgi:hypothetical protein
MACFGIFFASPVNIRVAGGQEGNPRRRSILDQNSLMDRYARYFGASKQLFETQEHRRSDMLSRNLLHAGVGGVLEGGTRVFEYQKRNCRRCFQSARCVGKPNKDGLSLDRRGPVSGSGQRDPVNFFGVAFQGR